MRENIFSVELLKLLHKVEQQRYTPKNPGVSRKLVPTQGNIWDTWGSVQSACIENFNPQVINRNAIIRDKAVNHLTGVSCIAGPQREDHPLTVSTVPSSLTADSTAHTLILASSALNTEPCSVYS